MKRPKPISSQEEAPAQPATRRRYDGVSRQITDGVAESNLKVLGEASAMAMGGLTQSFAHAQG